MKTTKNPPAHTIGRLAELAVQKVLLSWNWIANPISQQNNSTDFIVTPFDADPPYQVQPGDFWVQVKGTG